MIQVFFKKSPTGAPYFLAYSQGEHGFVTPQQAEMLLKNGIIDHVDLSAHQANPPEDYVTAEELDRREKEPDLSTEAGVKAMFGIDTKAMREYCRDKGIKVSKSVKRPETFWAKIAKA